MNTSLFIPYVFTGITEDDIKDVIERPDMLGKVDHIDLIKNKNKNGKSHNMAYVHMKSWYDTPNANTYHTMIERGDKCKIYYSTNTQKTPYWTILKNTYKNKDYIDIISCFIPCEPPKLIRNNPIHNINRDMSTTTSIYDDDDDDDIQLHIHITHDTGNRERELSSVKRQLFGDEIFETQGLVHESYVTKLESEIARLNNIINELQQKS